MKAPHHGAVFLRQNRVRANQRGNHPAPVDITNQNDRNICMGGKAHIGYIARAKIDFSRRTRAFHQHQIGAVTNLCKDSITAAMSCGFNS